jgi:hypothetical protein
VTNTPRDRSYVIRTAYRDLCDPGTFLPVQVVYGYAENDELLYVYATNADGSKYTGDISLLVAC